MRKDSFVAPTRSFCSYGKNRESKGMETSPSKRVLKTLRGNSKGKAHRGQYPLAAGLCRYKWY